MKTLLLCLFILWNALVFALYRRDKQSARKHRRRTFENTLLLAAFAGGGIGAFLGMALLRHKTRHGRFVLLLPLFLVASIVLFALICLYAPW